MKREFILSGSAVDAIDTVIHEKLRSEVAQQVRDACREMVQHEMQRVLRDEVVSIVHQVLSEGFVPTNAFGEPNGPPVSVRNFVLSEAREALQVKVSKAHGGPAQRYDHNTCTLAEYIIAKAIRDRLDVRIQQAVAALQEDDDGS